MKKLVAILSILLIATASYAQTSITESARKLCNDTGGVYYDLDDCPPCPKGAVCESCFVGCQCPQGKVWVDNVGCSNKELYEEAREQKRGLWRNKEGVKDGAYKFYYDNGNLAGEEHYKDGKKDGISKLYYENGNLMGKESFKDGKIIGTSIEYYEDGKFKGSYEYRDGKRNGKSKMVDEEGNLIFERYYKANKVVKGE